MTLDFRPRPRSEYAAKDCRQYAVYKDGFEIGTVESKRTESWRQTSSGVRYSLRGKPKHWEATTKAGKRVGYRHYSRREATQALVAELGQWPSRATDAAYPR